MQQSCITLSFLSLLHCTLLYRTLSVCFLPSREHVTLVKLLFLILILSHSLMQELTGALRRGSHYSPFYKLRSKSITLPYKFWRHLYKHQIHVSVVSYSGVVIMSVFTVWLPPHKFICLPAFSPSLSIINLSIYLSVTVPHTWT